MKHVKRYNDGAGHRGPICTDSQGEGARHANQLPPAWTIGFRCTHPLCRWSRCIVAGGH